MLALADKQHRKLAVAPMMEWTDRHCRAFHRRLAPMAMLYTEMVTADAVIHGDRKRLLGGGHLSTGDRAVALQLGGSEPEKLAEAVRNAAPFGYAEYNLNVGCPSDRVQSGRFGACLMAEPELVAECAEAMAEAAGDRPVTVKCRIGIDDMDPEEGLDRFVGTVAKAGVGHFIVHARKAWLNGLSPKENRTVPPLDHDRVKRLKGAFPDLAISVNGGVADVDVATRLAGEFDGVMVGRAAYEKPFTLAGMAAAIHGHGHADRFAVARSMADYAEGAMTDGVRLIAVTRHMLGLMAGLPGARAWRRSLSEGARSPDAGPELILKAADAVEEATRSRDATVDLVA